MTYKVLTRSLKHMRAEKGWLLKFGVESLFFFGFLFLLWSCSSKKNVVGTEKVGSIFVDSNIPGATIELDDSTTGKQTPYTFKDIPVRSYKVSVKMEEYNSTPKFVEVREGRLDTVFFSLTNKVGAIWVNSNPEGAQIILDQDTIENLTPHTLDSVSVGEHIVSVKMPGFLPSPPESLVTVYENDTSSAEFELSLDTLHGSLSVSSNPSGATIVMDHETTDRTTPHLFLSEIPIGAHLVSVFKEAHSNDAPAKKVVNVAAGDTIEVVFNLSSASVDPDSVGQLAPDFELLDDSLELIRLYNYRGFVVIVMFWATGCPFCMLEVPFLQELYVQYSIDTLMIFAVNYEDDLATIRQEKADNGLTYHLLVGKGSQMLEDYDIPGDPPRTPVTIIIDRSGLIYSWVRGYQPGGKEEIEMRTALFELFGH